MKAEPKYKLGQIVEIRTLKINMDVVITKRVMKGDYDKEKYGFFYDFKHTMNIKDAWNWTDVSEESLYEMIWAAERHANEGREKLDLNMFL